MVAGTFSNFYLCFLANLGHVMNTKVVSNVMIHLLVKFQTYSTWVSKVMVKILPLCFLKTVIPERWKLNFSTILTTESDFELNTKVVACEII